MLKHLDVTLRDGGYRNQFSFPLEYIMEHIKNLTEILVKYIEIGCRKGSLKSMDNMGLCFNDYA
ncbi:hypothetical protein ME3_01020 [Bartonella melophagi K-2C]|uniref:Pyruvate carboxyltransferase domain-containing protein n=1 Tax=Bartonella melophagi K-2C TaxID=1094557 RepID=J1JZ44_9HYPH|nr:hypothetical protein ME3_01020 [Bartonella melophagi K-2C]